MANSVTSARCINLDWLEIHALEPPLQPHDAFYYRSCGYVVHEREYGTRVYKEMFVIEGKDGLPLLEVRRNPASSGLNGIHLDNETHIRLVNRSCYFDDAADMLDKFLTLHGYYKVRISRIDIALDFVTFDSGDDPAKFIRRYFKRKYSKINQGNIHAHGSDTWSGQQWNSLSWGAKTSVVSTKLYNKTLELYDAKFDVFAKPYIRHAWLCAGLIDNWERVTKDGNLVNVWRLEFSLKSAQARWVPIELDGIQKNYQSLPNTLETYKGRERILMMFASLQRHYFRFKYYEEDKRKDLCRDKKLFDFSGQQLVYKLGHDSYTPADNDPKIKKWSRLMALLQEYQMFTMQGDVKKSIEVVKNALADDELRMSAVHRFSREELTMLRMLINIRLNEPELTYNAALDKVKDYLGITDRVIKFEE